MLKNSLKAFLLLCFSLETLFASQKPFSPIPKKVQILDPLIDLQKPVGLSNFAGWSLYEDILLGALSTDEIAAYSSKSLNLIWKALSPGGLSSPIIIKDKSALVSFRDGSLHKFNAFTGSKIWSLTLPSAVIGKMIFVDDMVLALSAKLTFYAIDFEKGVILHMFDLPGQPDLLLQTLVKPVVTGSKIILVSPSGEIFAFDRKTFNLDWRFFPEEFKHSKFKDPVGDVFCDGKQLVYARNDRKVFFFPGIDKDYQIFKSIDLSAVISSAASDKNFFYAATEDGKLYKINLESKEITWTIDLGPASVTKNTIVDLKVLGGQLFAFENSGKLLVVDTQSKELLWGYDFAYPIYNGLNRINHPESNSSSFVFSTSLAHYEFIWPL